MQGYRKSLYLKSSILVRIRCIENICECVWWTNVLTALQKNCLSQFHTSTKIEFNLYALPKYISGTKAVQELGEDISRHCWCRVRAKNSKTIRQPGSTLCFSIKNEQKNGVDKKYRAKQKRIGNEISVYGFGRIDKDLCICLLEILCIGCCHKNRHMSGILHNSVCL